MSWRSIIWPTFTLFLFSLVCLHAYLGRYAHPVADDLSYALKDASSGPWEAARWEYLHWNGRYASNFLVLFGPMRHGWAGLMLYRCVPALLIIANLGTMFLFLRALTGRMLRPAHTFIAAIIWLTLFLHLMPDMGEGLYWYTGSITYTLAFPFVLLAAALLLQSDTGPSLSKVIPASLLLFVATGFNEVIMALLMVSSGATMAARLRRGQGAGLVQWLPFLAIAAGALVMILAPGNAGRAAHFTGTHRLLPSIGMSLLQTARFPFTWVSCGAFFILSILWWLNRSWLLQRVPQIARGFGLSPLITTLSLGAVVFLCVFPPYWSTGILGQHRTVNTACSFFLPLWFVNLSAWAERLPRLRSPWRPDMRLTGALLLLLIADMAVTGNSASALGDLLTGRAERFDMQMRQRYQLLQEAASSPDGLGEIPYISDPPRSLYVLDLRDPDFLVNRDYAAWFGLKEVRPIPAPQSEPAKTTN